MKLNTITVKRYDADEGKVFDWANLKEHITEDENGNKVQEHLYVKTLFLSSSDKIENYVEVVYLPMEE